MNPAAEELLARLMSDASFRDIYLTNPERCMAEAGVDENDRVELRRVNLDTLLDGTYAEKRRAPSRDHSMVRGA